MNEMPDERPWTEAQWEEFHYESEVRSARYGDLFETLHTEPNFQEIIRQETGWPRDSHRHIGGNGASSSHCQ